MSRMEKRSSRDSTNEETKREPSSLKRDHDDSTLGSNTRQRQDRSESHGKSHSRRKHRSKSSRRYSSRHNQRRHRRSTSRSRSASSSESIESEDSTHTGSRRRSKRSKKRKHKRDSKKSNKKKRRKRRRSRSSSSSSPSTKSKESKCSKVVGRGELPPINSSEATGTGEGNDPHTTKSSSSAVLASAPASQTQPQTPITHSKKASMAPMSKADYDKQQATIRQVYDAASGRVRLIRGTGEIIESLVSRTEHEAINQRSTRGDGAFYSSSVLHALTRRK